MDLHAEKEKINEIIKSGLFTYRGVDFIIDTNSTNAHPANVNLGPQKGLMKFVGSDTTGQVTIAVFSHLVDVYNPRRHLEDVPDTVIDIDLPPSPLVAPETEDWERALEDVTPKPKGKKKKQSD